MTVKLSSGQKVYLRPYELEDAEYLYRGIYDPEGRRLTGTRHLFSRSAIQSYIERIASDNSRVDLVICSQDSEQPVGEVVLNEIDTYNRSANVRIGLFGEEHFGKGYGTEAMWLMLDYAFGTLNLHRISLGVFAFNERAIHVYAKLGFRREGVLRDSLFYSHQYHDQILMSILEDEFRERKP